MKKLLIFVLLFSFVLLFNLKNINSNTIDFAENITNFHESTTSYFNFPSDSQYMVDENFNFGATNISVIPDSTVIFFTPINTSFKYLTNNISNPKWKILMGTTGNSLSYLYGRVAKFYDWRDSSEITFGDTSQNSVGSSTNITFQGCFGFNKLIPYSREINIYNHDPSWGFYFGFEGPTSNTGNISFYEVFLEYEIDNNAYIGITTDLVNGSTYLTKYDGSFNLTHHITINEDVGIGIIKSNGISRNACYANYSGTKFEEDLEIYCNAGYQQIGLGWTDCINGTTTKNPNFNLGWNTISYRVYDGAGNMNQTNITFFLRAYDFLENSITYNQNADETSNQTFILNMSYDSENWLSASATFYYDNTSYSTTSSGSGDNLLFTNSLNVPLVDSDTNYSFYYTVKLTNSTGDFYYNSSINNQTVIDTPDLVVTSSSCSAGYFEAINYTFENEVNFTSLSPEISYNFKYGVGNLTAKEIYGAIASSNVLRVCVNSSIDNYKLGYGEIDYTPTGYTERRYYMFEGHALSNATTESYTLYSLENADSTSFIFEAKDPTLNPYTDNYFSLLRWYPSLNEYKIVEMASTDENGQSVMKVKTEDVDYRVGLYDKDGTLVKLAEAVRMACLVDPCTYTITVVATDSDYFEVFDVENSLTFDSTNNRFVFTWNDPGQNTDAMRLQVYKDAGYQQILICNSTGTGYTGVLTCSIGNYTGTFYAKVFRTASPEKLISTLYYTVRTGIESTFGLFLSMIIALATGLIGIFSPIGAIALLIVGLVVPLVFGVIDYAIFMAIVALGGIVIHFLRKT